MADDDTIENTIPTENCDNIRDDDNNEDEGSGEDKKGKRVRKRRKHQKKPHVPRFIGVEEAFVEWNKMLPIIFFITITWPEDR